MKLGMKNALGDVSYLTKFLNWHDMMVLSEGNNTKKFSDLEFIKEKVKYIDCEEEKENKDHITMFWKIYESFNYEDKKSLFNFWIGRSRIGWKEHSLKKEEFRIRLDAELAGKPPTSNPELLELVLPETYTDEDQFRAKLLEAMKKAAHENRPYV